MNDTDRLINEMLGSNEVALVPHNPSPSEELKTLFNHFNSLPANTFYQSVLNKYDESLDEKFEFALDTIKHYKGNFDHFDTDIEFDIYQRIKPWLSQNAISQFKSHYYKEYTFAYLGGRTLSLSPEILDILLARNVSLYIEVAQKMKIPDAGKKIFNREPFSIYEWLNKSPDVYDELKKLNEPNFILHNMDGRLSISDGAIKYIIEHTEPNKELFLSIKRMTGLKKFVELSSSTDTPIPLTEMVETLEDLNFVINTPDMSLNALEAILKTTKEKFPHIYDNLDSLLFVKKGFNNK